MIPVAVHSKGCWVRWTKVVVIPLLLVCCLHPYSHVRRTPSLVTRCCRWHIAFPTEGQCCSGWVRGEMRLGSHQNLKLWTAVSHSAIISIQFLLRGGFLLMEEQWAEGVSGLEGMWWQAILLISWNCLLIGLSVIKKALICHLLCVAAGPSSFVDLLTSVLLALFYVFKWDLSGFSVFLILLRRLCEIYRGNRVPKAIFFLTIFITVFGDFLCSFFSG